MHRKGALPTLRLSTLRNQSQNQNLNLNQNLNPDQGRDPIRILW